MHRRLLPAAALAVVACCTLGACSSSSTATGSHRSPDASPGAGSGSAGFTGTLTVAYQKFGSGIQLDAELKKVKADYETAHPGAKVKLLPIDAAENAYYTKLGLLNRSSGTAPDVLYEDTFLVNTDVASGYLAPLDGYLGAWKDWSLFSPSAQKAGKSLDGKTYGVPLGTDTRGLFYNKKIFAQAGLPATWAPKTWDDVLAAARTIKKKVPGVTPLNVYSGKGAGEGATMQGFEMLLYGTKHTLFDDSTQKWVSSSKGFTDSLNFVKTVYSEKLGPDVQDALNPNFSQTVATDLLPNSKLAIDLDGSWMPQNWTPTGAKPWPAWSSTLGTAAMPTQNGEAPGSNSMSGGWLLSVGSHAKNKQAAFDFIAVAANKQHSLDYANTASQIAERSDVAADPSYTNANPTTKFFTDLVQVTHFRPAYTVYARVSDAVQTTMENVMTGQQSVDAAAKTYATQLKGIAGADKTTPAP